MGLTVHEADWADEETFENATEWSVDQKGRLTILEPVEKTGMGSIVSGSGQNLRRVAEFADGQWAYVEVFEDD